jgi:hypothetical protein
MTKHFLFIIFGLLFFQLTYGQDKLTGRVFENKTRIWLSGIKIENLKTHNISVSDSAGRFSITAKIGDYLVFSGFAYRTDTIYIFNLKYTETLLEPKQNMLKEVKVSTPEIKTGSLKAPAQKGPFDSQTVLYQTDGNGNYIGGVKFMLFWTKDEKKKEKERQKMADEETKLQIAKVFSPQNIQNYLPLKGQELDNFIILYTPDVKTYVGSNFNFLLYLTASYKKFQTLPIAERQSSTYLRLSPH